MFTEDSDPSRCSCSPREIIQQHTICRLLSFFYSSLVDDVDEVSDPTRFQLYAAARFHYGFLNDVNCLDA